MDNNQSTAAYIGFAQLDDEQLNQLRALENELGGVLIALKSTVPLADLTDDQISRLQQYEKDHDVIILACKK
jgi:hypothetical protein